MENSISHQSRRNNAADVRCEKPCPPHGPILVEAVDEGAYVTSCLVCGLAGPKREDGWEAKLAFDEAFAGLPRSRS